MRSRLRATNETKCERILARSELLHSSDLAWDDVGKTAVDDGVLVCLAYMRDVEGFVDRDLAGLVAHPTTLRDPIVRRFLDVWRAEETEHARAIDRYLTLFAERRGVTLPAMQAPPSTVSRTEQVVVALTRPVGHVITAAHMAWGAANELLTMNGYRLLARRCNEPMLAELLTRIAAQESRHFSFYALQAQWRLTKSGLSRTALRAMMLRSWTPVGIGAEYKRPEEFDAVLEVLTDGDAGDRVIRTMDATFARLPGFEDLRIFERAVTESRARLAPAA
ncbi:MAG: hypothetical protein WD691_02485 [Acidimicrobiales bacterium]